MGRWGSSSAVGAFVLPDWAAMAIVGISVLLAIGVAGTMLVGARRPSRHGAATGADQSRLGLDIMLLVSAVGVVALAALVYLTR